MSVRVRFAPSPTGFLHIGSVRTALFNWLYARHTGGTFVLRIEDTDVARNTDQSLRTILDGLRWLGLDWDEGPEKGGMYGPYFQSQRADVYQRHIQELKDKGLAYERDGAVRFRMTRQPVEVPDLIAGRVTRPLNEAETLDPDFVIVRSDGNPVFHLVNVVDDMEMNITHVIRGEDHLSNTSKHIALFRAFGVEPPQYAHIPMILNPDGTKMSKSDPDAAKARLASLQTYVEDGFVPEAVRNYLCLLGWSPKDNREIMPIHDVVELFDLPQILRNNARFDVSKLTWMNGEYIRAMSLERFLELARPFTGGHDDPKVLGLVKEKLKLLRELPSWTDYFFRDDYAFDPVAVKKSCSAPQTSERLAKLADKFAAVNPWDAAHLEPALKTLAGELGVKTGDLIHPCRVAVSGKSAGPSLYHMLEVLGRDRVLARLRRGAEKFRS
ncbi:MAG TPA: glutamate--tRNA ligase family protein [Verrucomicrobiae bacterium]|nr:glutamate--tRNA ligase family protein [Verrucomicrobiae bacterium]